jgi:ATP-dependent DNA helicase PIF1
MSLNKMHEYRTQEAKKLGRPAYCIFSNKVICDTIESSPKTIGELGAIKGWGPKTIQRYGKDVISIILDPESPLPPGLTVEEIEATSDATKRKLDNEHVGIRPYNARNIPTQIREKMGQDPYAEDEGEPVTLNEGQEAAYKAVLSGYSILLTGEAGTGKSEVIKHLRRTTRHTNHQIALTSTTGTSALLVGGATIHSYLGIGTGTGTWKYMATFIRSRPALKKRWIDLDILVIDEVSMLSPELFDKLDKIGRFIRQNTRKPWGGIKLILCGDFLQLPVIGSDKFLFDAESWVDVIDEIHILTENVRQSGDPTWSDMLSRIRIGNITEHDYERLISRVGANVAAEGVKPTKLYSRNNQVDRENDTQIKLLADAGCQSREFHMTHAFKTYTGKTFKEAAILKLKEQCMAPSSLKICVGAQVMYLKNNTDLGLSNGSRGVVTSFSPSGEPVVKFKNGVEIPIVDEEFSVKNAEDGFCDLVLIQLPIKVAFAISIHKSQGVTLDCAEIDISECFCDGQAYVALSRVKTLEGMSLTRSFSKSNIKANEECLRFYAEDDAE